VPALQAFDLGDVWGASWSAYDESYLGLGLWASWGLVGLTF